LFANSPRISQWKPLSATVTNLLGGIPYYAEKFSNLNNSSFFTASKDAFEAARGAEQLTGTQKLAIQRCEEIKVFIVSHFYFMLTVVIFDCI
jgi:hypothetical protein